MTNYSFHSNDFDISFSTLKTTYGLYLRNISDVASTEFSGSNELPVSLERVEVSNKFAQPRTVVVEFGYDRRMPPESADDYLKSKLLGENKKIALKKTKGTTNKYLYGYVFKYEQLVFSDEPILQITMLCNPYWEGDEETITFTANNGWYIWSGTIKGDAPVGFRFIYDVLSLSQTDGGHFILDGSVVGNSSTSTYPFNRHFDLGTFNTESVLIDIPALYIFSTELPNYYSEYTSDGVIHRLSRLSYLHFTDYEDEGTIYPGTTFFKLPVNKTVYLSAYHDDTANGTLSLKYKPLYVR